ncbi:MAG: thioredoxin domain-containing protein [Nitrospirota bacterium]
MKKAGERFLFWLVIMIILVGSLYGLYRAVSTPENIPLPNELTEEDWIKGNPDADVVLIEYSDFQCPACSHFYEMVEDILDEFGNHILFAYRHFPLKTIHDKAVLASRATEAAGLQGKFWEMYAEIFENQTTWSILTVNAAENHFIKYAANLDLDQKQFIEDLNSKKVENIVEAEFQSALDGGLNSTPTFFLNGERIKNPKTLDEFRTLIRNAIEQTNT